MYSALVAKIDEIKIHPNADKLVIAIIHGIQVVVGIESKEGDIGLLFLGDGQLSEEYAIANDLIGIIDPITKLRQGGFFSKNRRVRQQSFRGVKSNGYFAPLESLSFTGGDISTLSEGTQLCEFNNVPICNKYFTPATLNAMKGGTPKTRKENKCFAKHVDTTQLKFIDSFPNNSIITVTEKIHGTSGRFGYVLDEQEKRRTWWDRLMRRNATIASYNHLQGTRNVVMGENHQGFYGNEEFRSKAIEQLIGKLHKGEVIYYELVGYTTTGAPIMGEQDITKLKDKKIQQGYGNIMRYKYGCQPNECKLYVYRITRVNEDGIAEDLSWPRVKARCWELELNHVPEIAWDPIVWGAGYQGNFNMFREMIEKELDGPSLLDPTHIREGVVIRVESEYGVDFFKAKSFTFGCLEGYLKEQDDAVDMEEIS